MRGEREVESELRKKEGEAEGARERKNEGRGRGVEKKGGIQHTAMLDVKFITLLFHIHLPHTPLSREGSMLL